MMVKHAIEIAEGSVGIYLILSGSEWLYLCSQPTLGPLIGRRAILLRLLDRGWPRPFSEALSRLSTPSGIRTMTIFQICIGVTLAVSALFSSQSPLFPIIALVFVIGFNSLYAVGLEGADQMATLVLLVLSLATAFPRAQPIAELFIAGQLILSYGIAGISKLRSTYWRSGEAIIMVLSTRSFGIGNAHWFTRNRWLAQTTCIFIIVFEIAWFAALFNMRLAEALMVLGLLFHIGTAWIMGLNLFPWAFLAAYPLTLDVIARIHS